MAAAAADCRQGMMSRDYVRDGRGYDEWRLSMGVAVALTDGWQN